MQENRRKYSKEIVKEWAEYFNSGHTLTETSEFFKVPYKSVVHLLTKEGFRKQSREQTKLRKQRQNSIDYFKNIDTHEKAYFLGLLFSDGYLYSSYYDITKSVGIALQLRDSYVLEYLKEKLNLTGKISIYKNSAKLVITNFSVYNDLINLGMIENKSHSEYHIPNISEEFINSFILGYFDGDGCITLKKSGAVVVSICGNSKLFFNELQEVLRKNGIETRLNCEINHDPSRILYVLYLKGRPNQLRFMDFIYKDCPIYLKRKKEKFDEMPKTYHQYKSKDLRNIDIRLLNL